MVGNQLQDVFLTVKRHAKYIKLALILGLNIPDVV